MEDKKIGNKKICKVCNYSWEAKINPTSEKKIWIKYCPKCHSKAWEVGANYPCQVCGRIQLIPLLHHIDKNRKNNNKKNHIWICNQCHIAIHHGFKDSGKRLRKYYIGGKDLDSIDKKRRYLKDKRNRIILKNLRAKLII